VVRVRLALGVKIVRKVLPEKETTTMRRNADSVNWVKQRRLKVPLNATLVISGSLVKPKVFVQLAQTDFIKSPKVKADVFNVSWGNRTSMPKQRALVVTLVRLVITATAIAKHARLDSIKIPKVKQSAVIPVLHREKYPTTKARDVNRRRGECAVSVNI
tara:strand:+ start:38 stop:514 length:477 start_codon:yes stop_codon:yes gene_type:complete